MTYKETAAMVATTNIPNAYHHFSEAEAPKPPFICFYFDSDNDFAADDTNYQKIAHLFIELYTDNKDFAKEEAVEDVLNANGIVYTREETYIASERLYEVIFEADIVISEELTNG